MFLMLGGVLHKFLKIIQHVCLYFIGANLISNMLFLKLLLLFDIYLTYNLQVMWMPYSEERLVVAPTGDISGMDI
jgi:hypothetical protein